MTHKVKHTKKGYSKMVLGAIGAITTGTLLFSGFSYQVMAVELEKAEMIPTSYSTVSASASRDSVPKGYTKADYTVVQQDLESVRNNNKPTSKDLTQEQAAEAGAQVLWEYFGVDLTNANIYMSYLPATKDFPRARWSGDVRFGSRTSPDGTPGVYCYTFSLDAVNGERHAAGIGRTLAVKTPLELDMTLAKNPKEYTSLAGALAREHDVVHGEVKSAVYNSQGYSENDPTISITVTGVNGEEALINFSRYDQKLLGIVFDGSVKIGDAAMRRFLEEAERSSNTVQNGQSASGEASKMIALS